ncbi:serine hydrolase domain-containing protein [Terrilactibacillus laevilacticus]|uniref:Serine hydrolase domain-containing protein n=1 Tax=Terrilactibacillus laevilacticus TaxID=1380157 RepID=A0ABW5PMV5_9BACI|nr:serine hydrolase [Terrilactibacillus laevilacticus]
MINNDDLTKKIDAFLLSMINTRQIPGAVYSVFTKDETIVENALGLAHKDKKIEMNLDTLFDLASLTKVCATLPSLLLLVEKGLINFDDPLTHFFPNSINRNLTIKNLLTHTSGYIASVAFYNKSWNKDQILKYLLEVPIESNKNVIYSDLNFILLGFLIEKISQQSLDVFSKRNIYQRLEMYQTSFNPKVDINKIAPTEWLRDKKDYQWGKVHDENAFNLNGVSGHAGLFSNLKDLKIYARMLLNEGTTRSGKRFLSSEILKSSRNNYTRNLNANRGLGWQLIDDNMPTGNFLSKSSYGHTGFTGTSMLIDPNRKIGIILLTNRVHICRQINMNRIRKNFYDIVLAELNKEI